MQVGFRLTATRYLRQIPTADAIYVGSFQTAQCHLINSIRHNQLVLLDDGCGIHAVLNQIKNSSNHTPWSHRLTFRKGNLPEPSSLKVFSCFDVDWPHSLLTRNDYRCLRRRLQEEIAVRSDEAVFICQPIANEIGFSADYDYLRSMVLAQTKCKSLRFINHPKDPNPLQEGDTLPYPIELFGLQEGYLPKYFVTFCSSAIQTLKIIYNRPSLCLEIPSLNIPMNVQDHLRTIYRDYRSNGLHVIPYQ
ncbi:MAG: hypothetical protein R3C05_23975 [Pirellulaceae bacterium]